jgi:hypothetical protein
MCTNNCTYSGHQACNLNEEFPVHCKKKLAIFPPPAGMSLTKLFLGGNNFPPRKSLVSDIPSGDGKTANPFLQCIGNTYIGRHPHFFYAASFTFLASRLKGRGGGGANSAKGIWSGFYLHYIYVFVREILAAPTNDLANFLKQRSQFIPLLCGSIPTAATTLVLNVTLLSATTASQNSAYPQRTNLLNYDHALHIFYCKKCQWWFFFGFLLRPRLC